MSTVVPASSDGGVSKVAPALTATSVSTVTFTSSAIAISVSSGAPVSTAPLCRALPLLSPTVAFLAWFAETILAHA